MDLRAAVEEEFSTRLRLARQLRGMTQAELGGELGVSRQFVHQLETGSKLPSAELHDSCARALGFHSRFFASPIANEVRDDECHFRKRRATPQHMRSRAVAQGTLFAELVAWLDRNLHLPEVSLPTVDLSSTESIERGAEACRNAWGLGLDAPIDNVTRVLERAGVVVSTFDGVSNQVDAFSWYGPRPIVIRNLAKGCPARSRFDSSHECAHLVGHVGISTEDADREAEADRFASAFLLPRSSFPREFPRGARMDWQALVRMKERWGVSLQALIRRAFDLKLISSRQYRGAYIYISKRGWRTNEPGVVSDEPAELVANSIAVAEERLGISPASISSELGWDISVMRAVSGLTNISGEVSNVVSIHGRTTPRRPGA